MGSTLIFCLGNISTKLYKQDPSGDLQERQRSISYTIVVITTTHPHVIQTPADAGGEITMPIHAHIGHPPADVGSDGVSKVARQTLTDVNHSIANARMAYEKLQLTSWEPLLSKVEKFNGLMSQIAEVIKLHCKLCLSAFICPFVS
jgi:hypothetical protein